MDFRCIRLEDVTFDAIRFGRNGIQYGGNKAVTFQVPRSKYRVSTSKFSSSYVLTPISIDFPAEFSDFIHKLVDTSGVSMVQPFERLTTCDDTLIFDNEERRQDEIVPGTIVDASLLVSIRGTWTNRVTSGLVIDIDQIKIHTAVVPDLKPKVYINGVSM